MFTISLPSCSRYKANFKMDQSVFAIHDMQSVIVEISENDHPRTTHGNPRPRLLMNFRQFANAFLSPGLNSGAELVPRPGLTPRTALRAGYSKV